MHDFPKHAALELYGFIGYYANYSTLWHVLIYVCLLADLIIAFLSYSWYT